MVKLLVKYIPKKMNVLADQRNRQDQVLYVEWSVLPQVFNVICEVFCLPHTALFATIVNVKLLLYVSPVPVPMAWKQDAF